MVVGGCLCAATGAFFCEAGAVSLFFEKGDPKPLVGLLTPYEESNRQMLVVFLVFCTSYKKIACDSSHCGLVFSSSGIGNRFVTET